MNKFLLTTMLFASTFVGFDLCAQEAKKIENNDVVEYVNNDVVFYNFSNDLLAAAQSCAPFSENFASNNPYFAESRGKFFDVNISIEGWKEDSLCHFSVEQKQYGSFTHTSFCKANPAQLDKIVKAMSDTSNKPVTITIDDGSRYRKDKNGKRVAVKTKMTDSLFNITMKELRNKICNGNYKEASREEVADYEARLDEFSPEFATALANCEPALGESELSFVQASILGMQDGYCMVEMTPFVLGLSSEKIGQLTSYNQLVALRLDENVGTYVPYEDAKQMLFILNRCAEEGDYATGEKIYEEAGFASKSGLKVEYVEGYCDIEFVDVLEIDSITEDYSKFCSIENEALKTILAPYNELYQQTKGREVEENGKSLWQSDVLNAQTQEAGLNLWAQVQANGKCE